MGSYVLAIDQGTTGSTVLLFNEAGEVVGRHYSEFEQIYPKPGWVEHNAEEIWTVTRDLAKKAVDGHQIAGLGITNQRETTVVWDRHTGRPIHNAIVWQCRRTADICRDLAEHADLFRERTGLLLDAYFSGTKVKWILDHVAGAREKAEAGDLLFGNIDTWLIWKLSGGKAHVTDYTNASRTLMFDIIDRKWNPQLLEILGVPASMLPGVKASSEVVAHTTEVLEDIPISGIAGDQQAALYGQGCFEPGLVKNTYGTGCFMMMHTGDQPVFSPGLLTTLACNEDGSPGFALEGSVFTAGAVVQWLRDGLGLIQNAAETDEIARSLDNNGDVYLVPAFVGLGAPYWDMDARGVICGLTRGSGRAHIVRAALESIAYQSRDVLELMNQASGLDIRELRVDGGATANEFLMQFQASQLNCRVLRGSEVEMTAMGAALLAGHAVDFWDVGRLQETRSKTASIFEPDGDEARRSARYQGWQAAVARARSTKA